MKIILPFPTDTTEAEALQLLRDALGEFKTRREPPALYVHGRYGRGSLIDPEKKTAQVHKRVDAAAHALHGMEALEPMVLRAVVPAKPQTEEQEEILRQAIEEWKKSPEYAVIQPITDMSPAIVHLRERARQEYSSDDVAVYDDAKVSEVDGGVWVEAHVWLYNEEEPILPTEALTELGETQKERAERKGMEFAVPSNAQEAVEIAEILEAKDVEMEDLDDLVHSAASLLASATNNSSMPEQVQFLLEQGFRGADILATEPSSG